jgi:formyltetrahydrofolate hydrolase
LSIEILRKVPGFEVGNFSRYAVREEVGDVIVQLLDPVGMLLAKSWNVVNISKEGRRDTEQLFVMVACVRAYLRLLLSRARSGELPLRGFLTTIERVLIFSESRAGRKTAEKCGLDWRHILPRTDIKSATELELVALRESRLPRWLAKIELHRLSQSPNPLHRQMLAILAETAQQPDRL